MKNIFFNLIVFLSLFNINILAAENYIASTPEIDTNNTLLVSLADELDRNPTKIYNWVYNNIKFEDYDLARKDSLSVYWTKRGNEWDTSSLLIALLRISGYEARYVMYAAPATDIYTNNVVVEVKIPMNLYRGIGSKEFQWISLVPWSKDYKIDKGVDLFPITDDLKIKQELIFDFDDYINSKKQKNSIELFEEQLQSYLNTSLEYQGKTLKDLGSKKYINKSDFSILPLSLPKDITFTSDNLKTHYEKIPTDAKVKIDYYIYNSTVEEPTDSNYALFYRFYLSEVSSKMVSFRTSTGNSTGYLEVDGNVVETTRYNIPSSGFFDAHKIGEDLEIRPKKSRGTIISLDFDVLSASQEKFDYLKQKSLDNHTQKVYYLSVLNQLWKLRKYENNNKVNRYYNVKINMSSTSVQVSRVYANENYIKTTSLEKFGFYGGIHIDAFSPSSHKAKSFSDKYLSWDHYLSKAIRDMSMYSSSYNEGVIFEDLQSSFGASTIKGLMVANELGIPVTWITKFNYNYYFNENHTNSHNSCENKYSENKLQNIKNRLDNGSLKKILMPICIPYVEDLFLKISLEKTATGDSYLFGMNHGGASSKEITTTEETTTTDIATIIDNNSSTNFYNTNSDTSSSFVNEVQINQDSYAEAKVEGDGDPVDMLKGEFYQEEKTDISIKSSGSNILEIKRTYKSQLDYNGPFGYGWAWNHMEQLLFLANGDFSYLNNNGTFSTIKTNNSKTSFYYVNGAKYELSRVGEEYHMIYFDGSKKIFDKNGILKEKIDQNGNRLIFNRASQDKISSITDNHGQSLIFTYTEDNVTEIVDNSGRSVSYGYGDGGDNNDLTSFTSLVNKTTKYEYLKDQENAYNNHNMKKFILPNGDFLEISYFKNDQVSHHTNSKGDTFNFLYSRYNKYSETWNEKGFYKKLFYNTDGDLIRVDNRDGTIETKEYDENHNLRFHINGNGYISEYIYDDKRNLKTKKNPLGEVTEYTYNSKNKITSITDPEKNITSFTYYPNDLDIMKKISADNTKTTYTYDDYGNILTITDANSDIITKEYDNSGINLEWEEDKKGNKTYYAEYTSYGKAKTIRKEINSNVYNETALNYYDDGKIKDKIIHYDDSSDTTSYEYTDNGKIKFIKYPNDSVETHTYYAAKDIVVGNLLKEKIDPLDNAITYYYDELGNKVEQKDKRGFSTYFTYDGLNRLTSKTLSNSLTSTYTYDGVGNKVKEELYTFDMLSATSQVITTKYTYNKANRLIKKEQANGFVVEYEYDKNGNKTLEYYTVNGKTVKTKYEYNSINKLDKSIKGFQSDNPRITNYTYDKLGRKDTKTNANNVITKYEYDKNGNPTKRFINDVLVEEKVYDGLNRLIEYYDGERNKTSYVYNAKNQKIKTIDAKNYEFEYVYDNMGNIIKEISPDSSYKIYTYDLLSRPISKTNSLAQTQYLSYDANGNVVRITDSKGNISVFSYNELNQQIAQLNALNDRKSMTYDARGNLIASIDFGGNLITYSYDIMNNKISQAVHLEDKEVTTIFNYDKLGRVESITDPREYTTEYTYNIFNEKTKTTDASYKYSITQYDNLGRVDYIIDKREIKTNFTYNNYNQKTKTIQAEGTQDESITEFEYDLAGNLLSQDTKIVDTTYRISSQQRVSYAYDELNRQTNTYINAKQVSSKEYDSVGNTTLTKDAKENTIAYTYDANNNILSKTDAQKNIIKYSYDRNKNLTSTTTSLGIRKLNEYDKLDRLVSSTIDKGTKEYEYDSNGNLLKEVDNKGNITLHSYGKANRKFLTIKAFGTNNQSKIYYTYDKNGNIKTLKDENEKITNFEYDGLNRQIKKIYPSSKYVEYEYDENSNQKLIKKADGTIITQIHDSQNRIKTIKADGTIKQEFKYDTISRLTYVKDMNEGDKEYIVKYKYDSKNNIIESNQDGKIITKEYDLNSNLKYLNLPNKQVVNYTYNKNDRLKSIKKGSKKDNLEEIVVLTYNKDNQLNTQTLTKSDVILTLSYDKVGREKTRTYQNSSNDIIYSSKIDYDKNSNIIGNKETQKIASENRVTLKEYLYDEKDQITSYIKTDEIQTIMQRNIYGYDKAQNRVSNQIERNLKNSIKEILEVNEDNEYKAIKSNKEKVNIAYDDNGNIIEYKNKKYIFDFLNRLIALKDSNNNEIARYYYDAQNRRVEKLINNITTTYLYQNNQVVQERENGITTNTYYYGEYIDDPIAYSFDEQIYYYVKDNNYSVVSIINKNAKVVESYSYTPFGKISIKDQKGQVLLQSKINNTITYTGRRLDKESNLYYYRNRMYDPELGRFLSKDPKGYVDGMNLYAYVKNNPVRYLDPMGTTVRENFTDNFGTGSVYYSKSGRTNDYRVEYDYESQSSGFGYSSTVGNYNFNSSDNLYSYTDTRYGGSETFHQFENGEDTVSYTSYSSEIRIPDSNIFRDNTAGQVVSSIVGDTIAGFSDDRVNPISGIQLTRGEALDARVLSLASLIPSVKGISTFGKSSKIIDNIVDFSNFSKFDNVMSKVSQTYDDLTIKSSIYLNTTAKQSINSGIKHNVDTFKSISNVSYSIDPKQVAVVSGGLDTIYGAVSTEPPITATQFLGNRLKAWVYNPIFSDKKREE